MPPRLLIQADACQIGLKPDFASGGAIIAVVRGAVVHGAAGVDKPDIGRVAQTSGTQEAILRSVVVKPAFDKPCICL